MSDSEQNLKMHDYTDIINEFDKELLVRETDNDEEQDQFSNVTHITLEMLRKKPNIKNAMYEPLKHLFIEWEGDEEDKPEDFEEQQLLNIINLDPFIQTTVFECLNGIGDVTEQEGTEMYLPSIFDSDLFQELQLYEQLGGFREDHEGIPAKYFNLSNNNLDKIYKHPEARKILATLPNSSITDNFVEHLCSENV